jgi:hypothetical protein
MIDGISADQLMGQWASVWGVSETYWLVTVCTF